MSRGEELARRNLFEELLALRDAQRKERENSIVLVKGKELPWEKNRQGMMKWYMHPAIKDTAIRSLIIYVEQIPPGSRSGRQQYQGGVVIYIIAGKGFSMIDGVKHAWKKGDCVNIPLRRDGVVVQHFNEDPENAVELIVCEPNLTDALHLDRGCGFEQLENCPEYED